MSTRFLFFDLGNVLIRFCTDRLFAQVSAVVDRSPDWVHQNLYSSALLRRAECGHVTTEEFYQHVCELLPEKEIPLETLLLAANNIFDLNEPMYQVLVQISESGLPCGLLSNIGPWHWKHCLTTFPEVFRCLPSHHILSYKVGAMKPARDIFDAAFQVAEKTVPGIVPGEVLFIDDLEKNVLGAEEFGFDAVHYSFMEHEALLEQLRLRRIL